LVYTLRLVATELIWDPGEGIAVAMCVGEGKRMQSGSWWTGSGFGAGMSRRRVEADEHDRGSDDGPDGVP